MGLKELEALVAVLQAEIDKGREDNHVIGTWHIHFEKRGETPVFSFNKCESEVFGVDGSLVDPGGPLFQE